MPAEPRGRPRPGEESRPRLRPRQQPWSKGRAHRACNPQRGLDSPRPPTQPPHLIPCGRVFGVHRQEGHGTALRHQGAVVLGGQPHCGGGAGRTSARVSTQPGPRGRGEEVLSTAFLAPPQAHQVLVCKTGVVFRQRKQGPVRARLGEASEADDEQNKATPSCQAQPRVWAGIWLWPGRSGVGGRSGTGE